MKKFFTLLTIAAFVLAAASCSVTDVDETMELTQYETLSVDAMDVSIMKLNSGRSFAGYPYPGSAYEGVAEIVTFRGDTVCVAYSAQGLEADLPAGTWKIDETGKKILFSDFSIRDLNSSVIYKIAEAVIYKRAIDGQVAMKMAFESDGEPVYDSAFEYLQYIGLEPSVAPWTPVHYTINL